MTHETTFHDINNDLETVDQCMDMRAAQESLKEAFSVFGSNVPDYAIKIGQVAERFATAGTGISRSVFTPETNFGSEGFVDKIKDTGKRIVEFIAKIIQRIVEWYKDISNDPVKLKAKIDAIKKEITGLDNIPHEIEYENPPMTLMHDGAPITDINKYIEELGFTRKMLAQIFNIGRISNSGFIRVINTVNSTKSSDGVVSWFRSDQVKGFIKALHLEEIGSATDGETQTVSSKLMLGDLKFTYTFPTRATDDTMSNSEKGKFVRQHKFRFETKSATTFKGVMKNVNKSKLLEVLVEIEELLEFYKESLEYQKTEGVKTFKALESIAKVLTASTHITGTLVDGDVILVGIQTMTAMSNTLIGYPITYITNILRGVEYIMKKCLQEVKYEYSNSRQVATV